MPYCTTCAARFKGRGNHCALHNPYFFNQSHDHYNYNSDSTDPNEIKYRTVRFTDNGYHKHKNRVPRNYGNYQLTNDFDYGYDNRNAVVRYNSGYENALNSITSTAIPQSLTTTFNTLTVNHAVASMTYSVAPSGARSVTAHANLEREQCSSCRKWFPDREKLEYHQLEFPIGCDVHRMCIREEDARWHGTSERHDRCFVRGCHSIYRREGRWKGSVIEDHVRQWHT